MPTRTRRNPVSREEAARRIDHRSSVSYADASMIRKRSILTWAVLGGAFAVSFAWLMSYDPGEDGRYRELARTQRLWARVARYRFAALFSTGSPTVAQRIGRHLEERLRTKAERLEQSLLRSGGLVSLSFYAPRLQQRQTQIHKELMEVCRNRPSTPMLEYRFFGSFSSDDTIHMVCRPEEVAFLQSAFCCDVTNRVAYGVLRRLGGSRDDVVCRLPDRSVVDLDTCHKWLNESVAAGWMAGVSSEIDGSGYTRIVCTRKKP